MTPEEKSELKRLGDAVSKITMEVVELRKKALKPETELMGKAADGIITLGELEATVKVLNNYKKQGFTTIQL